MKIARIDMRNGDPVDIPEADRYEILAGDSIVDVERVVSGLSGAKVIIFYPSQVTPEVVEAVACFDGASVEVVFDIDRYHYDVWYEAVSKFPGPIDVGCRYPLGTDTDWLRLFKAAYRIRFHADYIHITRETSATYYGGRKQSELSRIRRIPGLVLRLAPEIESEVYGDPTSDTVVEVETRERNVTEETQKRRGRKTK